MPFLGGLFSRKSKSSPRSKRDDHAASSMHASELDSALSSPTTSYGTADNSIPSHPNARNLLHPDSAHELPSNSVYPSQASVGITSTGKKLRLPFTRKKVLQRSDLWIGSSPNVNSPNFNSSPQSANNPRQSTSALPSKTDPEELRRLRPPPSRSAIFAAYGDPANNPSIHSLPDEVPVSKLSFPSPSPLPQSSKKTSLFSWSKGTSKSSPRSPLGDTTKSALDHVLPTGPDSGSTFNLKSFRHIQEPSSTRSNASNVSLALPVPRPRLRGESINSDSSQRISVAAFREVQARRSLAGSPSPSFRAPSPVPALLSPSTSTSSPQNAIQPRGRSNMLLYTSDSDSSTSSDDGTEDETIKRRPGMSHSGHNNHERKDKAKAKSEMGHKDGSCDSAASQRAPKSHSGHSRQPSDETKPRTSGNGLDFPPNSQSSLGHNSPAPKLQASASTTASSSFATVKLAGTQVTLTPGLDIGMYICRSYDLVDTQMFPS
jgi:serine/arginine repetitive matrix protein 2